jgi:folylpolyglutamate synthase/dihydrofolate synthase
MTELQRRLTELATRVRQGIRPGLTGIRALDARCGEPSQSLRAVVVAGTNGKGTCCRALEAIALEHGLRTALFTSPHRSRFNQRFRIDGQSVSDQELLRWMAAVDHDEFTFFEVSTAMAFWGFAQADVDLAILEVGMGGRLDAVNLVDGIASAVVSISKDHEQFLGHELHQIAAEKLGVARDARPLVLGSSLRPFLGRAEATNAKVWLNGRDWRSDQRSVDTNSFNMSRPAHLLFDTLWDAAAVAVPLAEAIGLHDASAVQRGLENFRHPLRGERMGGVTFDACHNEAGISGFAQWAVKYAPDADLLVALSGRDPEVLAPFCGQGRRWFTVAARHPKATGANALAHALEQRGERVESLTRDQAYDLLKARQPLDQDAVLAFGSIYAMGPLRDRLEEDCR